MASVNAVVTKSYESLSAVSAFVAVKLAKIMLVCPCVPENSFTINSSSL